MKEYEDWKESRWDFTKKISNWHFDTTQPPILGKDSYYHLCKFDSDFTKFIDLYKDKSEKLSWSNTAEGEFSGEELDLIKVNANPKSIVFERSPDVKNDKLVDSIVDYIGIDKSKKYLAYFHNQKTGQMLHVHIDTFNYKLDPKNLYSSSQMKRFIVFLKDWDLGQIFQLGNANFSQWRAGDCITWEWQDIPHCTANMGWTDRPLLQITGFVTEKTKYLINNGNKNLIVKLEKL